MADIKNFTNFKDYLLIGLSGAILSLAVHTWVIVNDLATKNAIREVLETENQKWKSEVKADISALQKETHETRVKVDFMQDHLNSDDHKRRKVTGR